MRLLVTGASGYLGTAFLDAAAGRGWDVVSVGRTAPTGPHAQFIEADLLAAADLSALVARANARILVHLAWYAEHGKYWSSPLNLRWVEASLRLAEAFCAGGGAHAVFAGTCAEYRWSDDPLREDLSPLEPSTLYGTAKDACRRLVAAICAQAGVSCAWGRVFLPYAGQEADARLVPSLIDALTGRRPAFGVNAEARRDFIHVTDVAQAFVTLAQAQAGGAFNVATGRAVTIGDVVRALAAILDADPAPILAMKGARPDDPACILGDAAKLRRLGWSAGVSLEDGLARSVAARRVR